MIAPEVTVEVGAARQERRLQYGFAQNVPLILALTILVGLSALYTGLFHGQLHRFPGVFEWTSIVNTAMPTVLVAVGQSIVVVTRGIDLSLGGIIDVSNSLAAVHMHSSPGSMVAWSGVVLQPILVTLATLAILQGLAIKILPEPGGSIPDGYSNALANPGGPWSIFYVVGIAGLWLVLRRTATGVRIFALGNDEYAARAHGIPVRRVKTIAYALAGTLAAASGLFLAATTTAGDPAAGDVYVLTSIAAVVLGGVSFFGGRGSALGSIAGAFTLTILTNVLFFAGIDSLYQSFFQGLFLFVAVLLGSFLGYLLRRRT
jgi:ribose transport system permease protein